jgi:hypothetical protein
MYPQLTLIAAQEHIADLQRAADHDRLVHAVAPAKSSHAAAATQDDAATPVRFMRRLRRSHLAAR